MRPGMISNFMTLCEDAPNNLRVRSSILPDQEEGSLDVALFQHFEQTRCIFRTGPIVEGHRDEWLIDVCLSIGGSLCRCFIRCRTWLRFLGLSNEPAQKPK